MLQRFRCISIKVIRSRVNNTCRTKCPALIFGTLSTITVTTILMKCVSSTKYRILETARNSVLQMQILGDRSSIYKD